MGVGEILAILKARDVTLTPTDTEGLLVDGPEDALTDELIEAIRANKRALRTFLTSERSEGPKRPQEPAPHSDPSETILAVGDRCYLLAPDGSTHNISEAWTVDEIVTTPEGALAIFADRPYREWPLSMCRLARRDPAHTPPT